VFIMVGGSKTLKDPLELRPPARLEGPERAFSGASLVPLLESM
jgi:hypothetical protein